MEMCVIVFPVIRSDAIHLKFIYSSHDGVLTGYEFVLKERLSILYFE
jgi:hypothetical protein